MNIIFNSNAVFNCIFDQMNAALVRIRYFFFENSKHLNVMSKCINVKVMNYHHNVKLLFIVLLISFALKKIYFII